ncbi:MAG TPA: winged helix-turn-helix domain-containing protein [Vicinamibacterales bacterium]|nr:winged helix-turn-helix domain-containing protein [Vicinamibacterales bacterium]
MTSRSRRIYEFADYRIDTVNRLLVRAGTPVPLKAKVADTLLILLRHPAEVVDKEALIAELWPDTFVEEGNLTQNIYVLRKAMADAEHIETIPRRGYRFVTPVRVTEASEDQVGPVVPPATPAPVTAPERPSWRVLTWSVLALLAAISTIVFWPRPEPARFEAIQLSRMTTAGTIVKAAISPDGKYLGFVAAVGGKSSLHVRQLAAGKDLELVAPSAVDYYGLTFSHDGNFLYYVSQAFSEVGKLFRVPLLGGTPVHLVDDIDSPVTTSPDGKHLAYIRFAPSERSIIVANADGSGERRLASTHIDDPFQIAPVILVGPAWSKDGKTIACPVGVTSANSDYQTIRGFDAVTGAARELTSRQWQTLGRIEWLPQGGLIATAADLRSGPQLQVWMVEPNGEVRPITNDLADYRDLSLTANGRSILTVQTERRGNIFISPSEGKEAPRQVTSTNYDGLGGVSWTPDDRIVFTQQTGAEQNLWITSAGGGRAEPLTRQAGMNRRPTVSPDGRYIVFVSNRSGREHLWRIDINGDHPIELTHGVADGEPSFIDGGRALAYRTTVADHRYVYRIGIDGGEPVRIISQFGAEPIASPDGRRIAFYHRRPGTTAPLLSVFPAAGGELQFLGSLPGYVGFFRWTPDNRDIAWSGRYQGPGNIWARPVDGGEPRMLTHWNEDPVFAFDWSRDGKWIAYSKGSLTSDAVMITAQKK